MSDRAVLTAVTSIIAITKPIDSVNNTNRAGTAGLALPAATGAVAGDFCGDVMVILWCERFQTAW